MRITRKGVALAGVLVAVSGPAFAGVDPQAVDLGAFQFIPTIDASTRFDDNIFNSAFVEEESWITSARPELQFVAQKDANTFAATYRGDYGIYHSSHIDDYDEHSFSLDALLGHKKRNEIRLAAVYDKLHEPRGTGASEGAAITRQAPDEYDLANLIGSWDFGANGAKFGAEFAGEYTNVEYTNNKNATRFRNRDEKGYGVKLYGRIQPKSRFFIEVEDLAIRYDEVPLVGSTLDSDQTIYSVGVDWEATAKTSGSAKFGRTEKNFKGVGRKDADETSWEVAVAWAPRTYSNVYLTTARAVRETNGVGSFIISTTNTVNWIHDWSSMLHSTIFASFGNDDYEDSSREDDLVNLSVGLDYDFRRWVNFGLNYAYEDRDSNSRRFSYDKNIFTISVDLSL